jgi:hypothetical protein
VATAAKTPVKTVHARAPLQLRVNAFAITVSICGEAVDITLEPDTDPLKFFIVGLGSFPIEVTITGNTNTTTDDIYALADISIDRRAYSFSESIVSTNGYFNRGDFMTIEYDIYFGQDSIVKSCTFFLDY